MLQYSPQKKLYVPKEPQLASIMERLGERHDCFFSKLKAPEQNPNGYREPDWRAAQFTSEMLSALSSHPKIEIVKQFDASKYPVNCQSEDGKLLTVVMSPPTHLDWNKPINQGEGRHNTDKPDRLLATWQFLNLVLANLDHGVRVVIIEPDPDRKEGTFTRDIGFAIKNSMFLANMVSPVRRSEEATIAGGIKPPAEVLVEGGNIVLGDGVVFVGIGDRTNREAVEWLKFMVDKLGINLEVVPIQLKEGILHLDCAFCPIEKRNGNGGAAIVSPHAFASERDLELVKKMYGNTMEVTETEFQSLVTNLLSLDKDVRIASPDATNVHGLLEKLGIHPVLIEYFELIKAEGAWRCTELAVAREN
ncbi:MAG: arginine deiminase-related protein [Candidatus Anstonellaceae archaeon]